MKGLKMNVMIIQLKNRSIFNFTIRVEILFIYFFIFSLNKCNLTYLIFYNIK